MIPLLFREPCGLSIVSRAEKPLSVSRGTQEPVKLRTDLNCLVFCTVQYRITQPAWLKFCKRGSVFSVGVRVPCSKGFPKVLKRGSVFHLVLEWRGQRDFQLLDKKLKCAAHGCGVVGSSFASTLSYCSNGRVSSRRRKQFKVCKRHGSNRGDFPCYSSARQSSFSTRNLRIRDFGKRNGTIFQFLDQKIEGSPRSRQHPRFHKVIYAIT